jgi:hypothetical protein
MRSSETSLTLVFLLLTARSYYMHLHLGGTLAVPLTATPSLKAMLLE